MANFFDQFDNPQNFFDQFDPPKGDEVRAKAKQQVAKEKAAGFNEMPRFAEGIPFIGGLLDEATGVVQQGLYTLSGGRIGEPYEMGLELERARSARADEENPAMAATGKLAAGLATGGGLVGRIAPAQTVLGRVGQGVTIGAPLGFVEGFTRGEGNFGNRVASGTGGAVAGGAVGGVLPIGGALISRGYGAAADLVSPTITRMRSGPEAAADEILSRRMAREGASPAQKRLDLQQGQNAARFNPNSQAELPETLADTSDAMQRLAGSVYRAGGEAGNFVERGLRTRQRGPDNPYGRQAATAAPSQRQRVLDTTERALLIRSSQSARQTDQQIMRQQARDGNRLYTEARNRTEPFDLVGPMQRLRERLVDYPRPFAAKLEEAADLFTRDNRFVRNIAEFDASKKALDDMIEGASGNLKRELMTLKNELLEAVHGGPNGTRNAIYRQARETWGTAAENREAIELGRSALRDGSEVSAENYAALTPGQQTLFRLGFLESVRNSLGRTRPGNDATLLFQEPRVRELMNAIIPTPRGRTATFANRPERFGEVMRREGRMVQTERKVLGGSPTAQRQQDDMEFAGDTLRTMYDRFRQAPGLVNMGIEAVGVGIQKIFGYRQDVALALAQRLLTTDRATQNQILRRLSARGGPDVFARFADQVDRTAAQIAASSSPALIDATVRD